MRYRNALLDISENLNHALHQLDRFGVGKHAKVAGDLATAMMIIDHLIVGRVPERDEVMSVDRAIRVLRKTLSKIDESKDLQLAQTALSFVIHALYSSKAAHRQIRDAIAHIERWTDELYPEGTEDILSKVHSRLLMALQYMVQGNVHHLITDK